MKKRMLMIFRVLLIAATAMLGKVVGTDRPIIAIISYISYKEGSPCGGYCEKIPSSYIKWIESAGGRAVRMPYNATAVQVDSILSQVNGLLITGGDIEISDGARYAIERVAEMNNNGDVFPLWGTCLGFQWIMTTFSKNPNIVEDGFDSEDINYPITYTDIGMGSRLFRHIPYNISIGASELPVTYNNHHMGVEPSKLLMDPDLHGMFEILTTNVDRQLRPFVSAVQARNMPIFGVQWHPEKANFEFGEVDGVPFEVTDHSELAVTFSWYLAKTFMHVARKNNHAFTSPEAEAAELLSYRPKTNIFAPEFMEAVTFGAENSQIYSKIFTENLENQTDNFKDKILAD